MNKRWDHIIVGTGSTGAVVAARLSEDPHRHVLALEAGPDYPTVQETPPDIRNAFTVSVDKHDWRYTAEAVPGRVIPYARGKVTGGCSAVNGSIVLRGLPSDYDEWAAAGCTGWGWRDILPYLKRIEDDPIDAPFHGKGGPIPVTRALPEELTTVQRAFTQACLANGFAPVADHNDPTASGVGPIPMNRRDNLRISTALAYLTPQVRRRTNLTIQPHTLVTRILFEGTKAIGVEVKTHGRLEKIFSEHVTLCAGAVHNPAILWRSGIGPKAKLLALGLPLVIDRPGVGENLIEHCQALVALIPRPGVLDPDSPDVQMLVHYTAPGGPANDMQLYCVNKLGRERFPELPPGASNLLYAVMICLNRPRSRGRIWLADTDPERQPHILLNLNTDPDDMRRMISGVRKCWDIANTGEFAALSQGVAVLTQAIVDDDRLLARYIDANCGTIWHPVGTCRMGPASDPMAVVDVKLRVHGAQNLCIADASVFYDHVSRNPLLTCLAIGERLAEWLIGGA
jgi:choline dehydrogenase